ncbi:MAG: BatD family protein [Bacteroidota bacterium]
MVVKNRSLQRAVLLLLLILAPLAMLKAQNIEISASAPKVVEVGQQFRYIITINEQVEKITPPKFEGFQILSGPNRSSSSSVSIINGEMQQTFTLRFTYILQAQEQGTYSIQPTVVKYKNKEHASNALSIDVIVAGSSSNTSSQGNKPETEAKPAKEREKNQQYVRILTSKTNVYRGEPIAVTLKLYTQLRLNDLSNLELPTFDGFMVQEIETPPLRNLKREAIEGEVYGTGILKKYLLFPQKAGKLRISPYKIDVIYSKPSEGSGSVFDDFFGTYDRFKQTLSSNAPVIRVKDLPSHAPSDFSGGVGSFKFTGTIDKLSGETNEALTFKLRVSGSGNLKIISPPKIDFPPDFEVYDPKITLNVKNTDSGTIGTKIFEYVLIPRFPGNYTIPEVRFHYFNVEKEAYETLATVPFKLEISKSEDDTTVAMTSSFAKEDVKFIGKDIRFIKTQSGDLREVDEFLLDDTLYWVLYALALLMFLLVLVIRKKKQQELANVQLARNRRANKYARKRLKHASTHLKAGNKEAYYEELAKALWGYLSDKLAIPMAHLSADSAREAMEEKKIPQEDIDQILNLIETCEYARYAPKSDDSQMDKRYQQAIEVVSNLQNKLK